MEVRYKNYLITADDNQFILRDTNKPKHRGGKTHYSIIGYYTTITGVLTKLIHLSVAHGEDSSLGELVKSIGRYTQEIKDALNGL